MWGGSLPGDGPQGKGTGMGVCGKYKIGAVWKKQAEFSTSVTFQPCRLVHGMARTWKLISPPGSYLWLQWDCQAGRSLLSRDSICHPLNVGWKIFYLPFACPRSECPGNLCQSVHARFCLPSIFILRKFWKPLSLCPLEFQGNKDLGFS